MLQTGYLSMDQARSLLPLEATNVNVSTVLAEQASAWSCLLHVVPGDIWSWHLCSLQ